MNRRSFLASALASTLAPPLSATTPPRTVDAHVHVWAPNPNFPFAPNANVPPHLDASVETLLTRMQAAHVARTVLIQVIHYRYDNRYLVDCLHRFPTKFAGVCRVDPEDPSAPDHLSHWTEQGCRGVRLSPAADATGDWIRGPLMPALWQRCADLHVPMTLLTPIQRLPDIVPLLDRHPHLTVVIDHMADCPVDSPASLKQLTNLARYPNLFLKATHLWSLSHQPYPYRDAQTLVARLRDAFGSRRLMDGTDWPIKPQLCSYAARLAIYRSSLPFLNPTEREDLLHRTADHVWPLQPA